VDPKGRPRLRLSRHGLVREAGIRQGDRRTSTRPSVSIPGNDTAYRNRGMAWLVKQEYDKAIADFTELIRLDPRDGSPYQFRADAWSKKAEHDKSHRRPHRRHPTRTKERRTLIASAQTYWQEKRESPPRPSPITRRRFRLDPTIPISPTAMFLASSSRTDTQNTFPRRLLFAVRRSTRLVVPDRHTENLRLFSNSLLPGTPERQCTLQDAMTPCRAPQLRFSLEPAPPMSLSSKACPRCPRRTT